MAPRGAQEAPISAKMAPRWHHDGPKRPPRCSQELPKRPYEAPPRHPRRPRIPPHLLLVLPSYSSLLLNNDGGGVDDVDGGGRGGRGGRGGVSGDKRTRIRCSAEKDFLPPASRPVPPIQLHEEKKRKGGGAGGGGRGGRRGSDHKPGSDYFAKAIVCDSLSRRKFKSMILQQPSRQRVAFSHSVRRLRRARCTSPFIRE